MIAWPGEIGYCNGSAARCGSRSCAVVAVLRTRTRSVGCQVRSVLVSLPTGFTRAPTEGNAFRLPPAQLLTLPGVGSPQPPAEELAFAFREAATSNSMSVPTASCDAR